MSNKRSAFTLLELLISASLLAGLSVILLATLSGVVTSYTRHTLATKSNIQGQLVMQQLKDAVSQAVVFQVLRNKNKEDYVDSQLVVEKLSRDFTGAVIVPNQYDVFLYCMVPGSGKLMLFRNNNSQTSFIPTDSLFTISPLATPCDVHSLNKIYSQLSNPSIEIDLTADNIKVTAFDVRQVGVANYPPDASVITYNYPALRIEIVTQYSSSAPGSQERANSFSVDPPAQLLNETVIAGNAGPIANTVTSGT